jgi:hypothetical protein
MASVANLAVGQGVGLNLSTTGAIAAGTTVTAVNSSASTITISLATTASMSAGTKLYFGTATEAGSQLEVQRTSYNAYMRGNWAALGCTGLIDIDKVVADQTNIGKWRTDLGQGSADGVHPSQALHQAAVNAGIITPAMFAAP